jgi:hypothetical protein
MVGTGTANLQILFRGILGPYDTGRLGQAGCNTDPGTGNPGPDCNNFITGYFDSCQSLATNIPGCCTKINRVFSQTGMDSHGSALDFAPADCTTGATPVHGIPFNRSTDTTLLKDLGSASSFVHHYQEFLGKQRSEPLLNFIGSQGDHFIAENFVNRIIGNNDI